MKTVQFTPGPWVVNDNDTGMTDDGTIINLHGTVIVSSVYGQTTEIAAANAALIAAAPAMYEALKALVEVFPSVVKMTPYGVSMGISKIHDDAKAALTQAEGK